MRIFLTGGTGLVGSAVVKALIAKGEDVTTLARSEASAEIHESLGATPVAGSLVNPDGWVSQAMEHDAIIHAAATFDSDMGDVDHNLVGQLQDAAGQMQGARKIPFLYTGGCWLYPDAPVIPLTERHVLDPLPAFEWMLASIEQLHQCPTFNLSVIHPAQVVCPGRGLIARYAMELLANGRITIIGDANTHFPFIQADDLADLYCRALDHNGSGLLLNATGIKSATAGQVATLIAERLNRPLEIELLPVEEAQKQMGPWASGYARSQRMEADRAMDLLGWQPRFDSIEAMVEDSLQGMM